MNDIVIKAIAATLAEVPEANVFWDPVALEAKPYTTIDVCVAVATPRGLLTPIVKGANKKNLQQVGTMPPNVLCEILSPFHLIPSDKQGCSGLGAKGTRK